MIGSPRVHHRVADSTNQRGKELAAGGAPHGTVVTADEQTAGRGRQGRVWVAPAGSALLMSVVVRELDERAALLPLAAAVAVCEAAEALAPVRCAIKWPNDVWVEERKVCGILVEGRPAEGWAVVGVGLNVRVSEFPPDLAAIATSLSAAAGVTPTVEEALRETLVALDRRLRTPAAELLDAWRERDALRGRTIRWNGGEGVAAGIDDTGALVVNTPDGTVTLDAGEVHLVLS
ncbi:MAG: BirA family transcriptional regulator [Thermoleophilaceae bacterium]|jgi:BirA family biotin operon repressor/biotin-[acetyl-CoA-carboxylase] ligase|nr:BirA family transcriptional regulator [Thermoleophilaceae bacterium]